MQMNICINVMNICQEHLFPFVVNKCIKKETYLELCIKRDIFGITKLQTYMV